MSIFINNDFESNCAPFLFLVNYVAWERMSLYIYESICENNTVWEICLWFIIHFPAS